MEAHSSSHDDISDAKKRKFTLDHSLLHHFVDYVASLDESDTYTLEEVEECVRVLQSKEIIVSTPFQRVVKKKLRPLLPILLTCNNDVNFAGSRSQTILHIFILQYTDKRSTKEADWIKHRNIVETLLKKGASVDTVDLTGNTPVHCAAFNRRSDLVQLMLENFTNVNVLNSCKFTVLHFLIQNYTENPKDLDIEIIRTLICKGANYQMPEDNIKPSPLKTAIKYGLIKVLLAFQMNEDDSRELLLSISESANFWPNYPEELQHLTSLVDLSQSVHLRTTEGNLTPLHHVSKFGRRDAAELFVDAGADINAVTVDNITPLHLAVMHGHLEVVEFLIKRGANLLARDNIFDFGMLHLATSKGNPAIINLLIENGLDVNDRFSTNGFKPLHLAAMKGDEWTIKCLITHGADVNCRTRERQLTPLHLIVSNSFDVLREISNRQSSLISRDFFVGSSISQANYVESKCLLIQVGAYINARDSELKTPLYHVLDQRNVGMDVLTILKTLLKHGANVDVEDVNQMSPISAFQNHLCVNELKELLRYGADINDVDYVVPDSYTESYGSAHYLRLIQALGIPIKEKHRRDIERIDRDIERPRQLLNHPLMAGRGRMGERMNRNLNQKIECRDRFMGNRDFEIVKLKQYYLMDDETSLYNFLHMKSKHRLKFAEYVLSLDLETEFPIYHIVIENSCRRAINENLIMSSASSTLKQLIQVDLPDVCIKHIFKFMSLTEITLFIDLVQGYIL